MWRFSGGRTGRARLAVPAAAGDGNGLLEAIPMGRAGVPDDVAPAVRYLASDAAGYTTGELLHVDGGWQVA